MCLGMGANNRKYWKIQCLLCVEQLFSVFDAKDVFCKISPKGLNFKNSCAQLLQQPKILNVYCYFYFTSWGCWDLLWLF